MQAAASRLPGASASGEVCPVAADDRRSQAIWRALVFTNGKDIGRSWEELTECRLTTRGEAAICQSGACGHREACTEGAYCSVEQKNFIRSSQVFSRTSTICLIFAVSTDEA